MHILNGRSHDFLILQLNISSLTHNVRLAIIDFFTNSPTITMFELKFGLNALLLFEVFLITSISFFAIMKHDWDIKICGSENTPLNRITFHKIYLFSFLLQVSFLTFH